MDPHVAGRTARSLETLHALGYFAPEVEATEPVTVDAAPELVLPELVLVEPDVPEPDDPVSWGAAGAATTVSLAVAGPDVEVW